MRYTNNVVYCGEWKEDKKWGEGVICSPTGDKYQGKWKNDMECGQG